MSKKAQISDYLIMFIPKLIVLIIVIACISFLVHIYINTEVKTFDTEASLFIQRILYSRNGISSFDEETGQVSPGIIEYSQLSSTEVLEKKLSESLDFRNDRHIAAKMTVIDSQGQATEVFFNRKSFNDWIVLTNFPGPGGTQSLTRKLYILLRKGIGELEPGFLEITVVMPNS